ncbi:LysM peptidoglycan-binding domain-containing protein [Alicyclobacillaceae bacterium I2511]|nr:LysM peptidoglycan-binding domain-containing protein [Alicyclobacillaceae bacterium I2511]
MKYLRFVWKQRLLSVTTFGVALLFGSTAPALAATATSPIPNTATSPTPSTAVSAIASGKYVIAENDTFWSIAQRLQLPLSSLLAANPGVNPLNLYPGLTIQLPQSVVHVPISTTVSTISPTPAVNSVTYGKTISVDRLPYVKEISCVASAYTAAPSENPWGALDYLGNPLKLGTISVDPSVIPLGSTVYVTGYSFNGLPMGGMMGHASDEGGNIKGKHIDIFMPTSQSIASQFGLQHVQVYILK